MYEVEGASEFWAFRMGSKFTVPRFKSYLESWIDKPIVSVLVVPHQLYVAFTFDGLSVSDMLFWL